VFSDVNSVVNSARIRRLTGKLIRERRAFIVSKLERENSQPPQATVIDGV